ncbi:MAG TPA: sugar phosphate nucleotidyltransferase [bacterium]|nr:sugar phosphate nucleotidyltransferase [bacterium]HPO10142.1 sugar phosphate nucleotidyltransferase [bacterium]HQO33162.1 sugar phosphate nucleotidyltransferase [bacterium]HQP99928.1 sugar phosphate nucleotidyltransferase [bacterium]
MDNLAAVIPVAGHGTRMYPLTRGIKKEFLPLVDPDGRPRPLIQILAEEALESGVQQVCFVVNRQQRDLFEFYFHGGFSDDPGARKFPEEAEKIQEMGKRVVFVEQSEQLGLGHAVWCAVETLGRRPLMVLLGDHAFASTTPVRCIRQLLTVAESVTGSLSAVSWTREEDLRYFGTVLGKPVPDQPRLYEAVEIIEKPRVDYARSRLRTPGNPNAPYLCWLGFHLLSPTVLDCLEEMVQSRQEGTEVGLTEAQEMARRKEGYFVCELDAIRFDLGIPEGYRQTLHEWPGAVRSPINPDESKGAVI